MGVRLLLKRGGLLAAANWQTVAIQFVAQITFQMLLAVPLVGAAILVSSLIGGEPTALLQDTLDKTFTQIADALMAEPVALIGFIVSFATVLIGGSVLMFLVKGGTVSVMLAADAEAGPIEREPLTLDAVSEASAFSLVGFVAGCQRFFRRYLLLGLMLFIAYAVSGAAYLGFFVYGYRAAANSGLVIVWGLLAAMSAIGLVLWITCVNLLYLLVQIVCASEDESIGAALRLVIRFIRAEFFELGAMFLVMFSLVIAATIASGLALAGVAFIGFVPLVGMAAMPLQIATLVVRGLVFEYIGLTAMGSYVSLYRRYSAGRQAVPVPASPAARPASAG